MAADDAANAPPRGDELGGDEPGGNEPGGDGTGGDRHALRGLRARLGTVRVRTTALATIVVGVALAAGAVGLVLALRATLTSEVERSVRQQARAAAEVLESDGMPSLLVGDGADDDDVVAQVIDRDGHVVAASPAVEGAPALADPAPGRYATFEMPGEDERFLGVATTADTPEGPRTVLVAGTLEAVDESSTVVVGLLVVGLPALLLVVAATTWRVAGRALAPVEAIRSTVDAVSAADLGRRVPEPATSDEIARLAATMNRMLARLEQAQARQRRFVADAGHELRSPVATIRQHAEVAGRYPDRVVVGDLAETVLAEALRLQRLVDDLLVLARADEHALDLRRRPLDLDDVVLDEARRLRATTEVEVDASAVSAGAVDGDAGALRRVVRNVADNAARHAAGRVTLSLAEHDGTVTLAVEDDGPGIAAADRTRVLERFVRLDDARARDAGGSGLGLAIVAELVAAHGGSVAIGEAALGGARVEVTLPASA
ncbi:MAG TPA: HAMP domain-containing sensor histidine kinase [Acidimicrobiales bacterium]|nr:HAMP domain-containing sensor histidine kinase [Acidimicrobiales bacterium]